MAQQQNVGNFKKYALDPEGSSLQQWRKNNTARLDSCTHLFDWANTTSIGPQCRFFVTVV